MRKIGRAFLTGVAAIAAAGAAVAASHDTHVMKVELPDGSVARIEYKGDVPPKVAVAPVRPLSLPLPLPLPLPIGFVDMFDVTPLAVFDRVFEQMNRQSDLMLRQVVALRAGPQHANGQLDLAGIGSLPAGTVRYSLVSTSSGEGTCTRSMQVTSLGSGQPPKVVSSASGNCKDGPLGTTMATLPQATPGAAAVTSSAASDRATTI